MTYFFEKILKSYIAENKYKSLCEIGASKGANTNKLLQINGVSVSVVDPCLDENLCDKYKNDKRIKVFKGLSLDILPNIFSKGSVKIENTIRVVKRLRSKSIKILLRSAPEGVSQSFD